jgi:hypothetical protein
MNQAGAPARSRLHRSPSQTPVPDTGRVEPGPDNLRQQGGGDALVVSQDGDEKLVVHEDQSRGLLVLDLGVASCNRRQGASEGAGGDVLGNGVTDRLRDDPPDRPAPRRGPVKRSKAGERTVALPAVVVFVLLAHRTRRDEERTARGYWDDHGLVFCSEVGTPLDPSNVRKVFGVTIVSIFSASTTVIG